MKPNLLNTIKKTTLLCLLAITVSFDSQRGNAFDVGEWFKFRIHYGIINAGYATLEVKDAVLNGKKVFHAVGRGTTTGITKWVFRVEDNYESYFDKQTGKPYQYVRKIDEGGYKRNEEGFINQETNKIIVKDYKNNNEKIFATTEKMQDVISTFYYLRNYPGIDKMKIGEFMSIDMFFDNEIIKFKLKFNGREDVSTKFGTIPCMVFKPLVQSGRVFKEQESLTVWISDDDNKLPISIKASLAIGSLKADLESFKGLNNSFVTKQ